MRTSVLLLLYLDMAIKFHRYKERMHLDNIKKGDVVELEMGVFAKVLKPVSILNRVSTRVIHMIPETDFLEKYEWEWETINFFLDKIHDDWENKSCYIEIIEYIKENYKYEQFKEKLEKLRK